MKNKNEDLIMKATNWFYNTATGLFLTSWIIGSAAIAWNEGLKEAQKEVNELQNYGDPSGYHLDASEDAILAAQRDFTEKNSTALKGHLNEAFQNNIGKEGAQEIDVATEVEIDPAQLSREMYEYDLSAARTDRTFNGGVSVIFTVASIGFLGAGLHKGYKNVFWSRENSKKFPSLT